ncbi:LysR family transcriptional regulator [Streptomyces sp. DSM 41527]|uniref:LysR family transcriptional regulator n=1 Tax=Streptomyces mooreae TaxID=3075523 RepID=A0ABU2T5E1_9ACTN|nr:LysR family transcriptional regulator [Streptomyces sp. DSM 41527]MDT0456432.1 LysR family transcriptional regulator [Streptomyces sp. DSM 41527]
MDVHLLRTFVAVAQRSSFSDAARELGYTQSAVSQHVASLENDLGVALLARRPVSLTPAGARLLEHARPLLLRLEAARVDVSQPVASPADHLRLGVSPLAVTARLVDVLTRIRRDHPRTRVTLRVLERAMVAAQVARGSLDIGVVEGVVAANDPLQLPDVGPLKTTGVHEEEVAVLLPAGHPLEGRERVHLATLSDAQWIDAPEAATPLAQLRTICGSDTLPGAFSYEGMEVQTVLELAARGHGLVVLPRSVAQRATRVTAVALASPKLVHRTELLYNHTPQGSAEELVKALLGHG